MSLQRIIPKHPRSIVVWFFLLMLASCASREIALDPESEDFYQTVRLIMTGEEKDIFNHLPDKESRQEFIADFWAKRDPDPETEINEFREEYFSRIDYANKHFKEGGLGMNTDRGRIYIYLGPPDKIEEHLFTQTPEVRGSVLWWVYYELTSEGLGVEFIDERGNGTFKINQISGDLFDAMEHAKLGQMWASEGVFSKKYINFKLKYDRAKNEIEISIPVKSLSFREEGGLLKADFEFEFFIYQENLRKDRFKEAKSFVGQEDEVGRTEDIVLTFPYELPPGKSYIDVILVGKGGVGRARKIFKVKN